MEDLSDSDKTNDDPPESLPPAKESFFSEPIVTPKSVLLQSDTSSSSSSFISIHTGVTGSFESSTDDSPKISSFESRDSPSSTLELMKVRDIERKLGFDDSNVLDGSKSHISNKELQSSNFNFDQTPSDFNHASFISEPLPQIEILQTRDMSTNLYKNVDINAKDNKQPIKSLPSYESIEHHSKDNSSPSRKPLDALDNENECCRNSLIKLENTTIINNGSNFDETQTQRNEKDTSECDKLGEEEVKDTSKSDRIDEEEVDVISLSSDSDTDQSVVIDLTSSDSELKVTKKKESSCHDGAQLNTLRRNEDSSIPYCYSNSMNNEQQFDSFIMLSGRNRFAGDSYSMYVDTRVQMENIDVINVDKYDEPLLQEESRLEVENISHSQNSRCEIDKQSKYSIEEINASYLHERNSSSKLPTPCSIDKTPITIDIVEETKTSMRKDDVAIALDNSNHNDIVSVQLNKNRIVADSSLTTGEIVSSGSKNILENVNNENVTSFDKNEIYVDLVSELMTSETTNKEIESVSPQNFNNKNVSLDEKVNSVNEVMPSRNTRDEGEIVLLENADNENVFSFDKNKVYEDVACETVATENKNENESSKMNNVVNEEIELSCTNKIISSEHVEVIARENTYDEGILINNDNEVNVLDSDRNKDKICENENLPCSDDVGIDLLLDVNEDLNNIADNQDSDLKTNESLYDNCITCENENLPSSDSAGIDLLLDVNEDLNNIADNHDSNLKTNESLQVNVIIGPQVIPEKFESREEESPLRENNLHANHEPLFEKETRRQNVGFDKRQKKRKKKKQFNPKSVAMFSNCFSHSESPAKKSCTQLYDNLTTDDNNIEVNKHHAGLQDFEPSFESMDTAVCDYQHVRSVEEAAVKSISTSVEQSCLQPPKQVGVSFKEFQSRRENHLRGCLWSPDGTSILTNSDDNILRLFRIPDDLLDIYLEEELCANLKMNEGESVYDMEWYPYMDATNPDTCCFLSTSRDHPIHLWDSCTGHVRCSYRPHNQLDELTSAHSVAFNIDGSKVYCGFDKCIRIFDSSRPGTECMERNTVAKKNQSRKARFKQSLNQSGIISSIAFSGGCNGLYALGSFARTVGLYDANDGNPLFLLHGHTGGVTQVKFTADGFYLMSGARKDEEIIWWDIRNTSTPLFKLLREVSTNQRIQFDIDRYGFQVFSGSTNKMINIWDLRSILDENQENVAYYQPTYQFCAHDDAVNAVCLHPSKPLLASTSGQRHFFTDSDSDGCGTERADTTTVIDNSLKIWKLE